MDFNPSTYQSAIHDFQYARQQAALQEIIGRLTGKPARLLSYDEVADQLKLVGRKELGIKQIPIDAIVGSVGRYTDFTRTFLPRLKQDEQRWARVKTSSKDGQVPPIDVYQVGEVYFVLDGNHRVSIARQEGREQIDACVIEVPTNIPLTADVQPDDLIVKADYARFLEQTCLADLLPNVDISLTAPGQYDKLRQQIEIHQRLLEHEQRGSPSRREAILSWYDNVYLPMVSAIRETGLLRWTPNRTPADLYMWVSEHLQALEEELGWAIRPEAAVADLVAREGNIPNRRENTPGKWRKSKMLDRYTEHLFKDILVPLSGKEDGWDALEQALAVAAREDAKVDGLYLVRSESQKETAKVESIEARFIQTCEACGVNGRFVAETGEIVTKVCERALLTDLVVLNGGNPPAAGFHGLRSKLRAIIWRCSRPILSVCCNVSPMNKALLAFDGSLRSREALFVAAYLSEQWMTSLTVLAVTDEGGVNSSVLDYARAYLELHEIEADYLAESGSIDILHKVMDERGTNLLLMGSYSASVMGELIKNSAVNIMLRQNHCPIFICR